MVFGEHAVVQLQLVCGSTIEIDTLEKQQTEKIETEMKDVDRIRIRKVYASCPGWPSGGSKEFSSQTQIYAIPCRLQLPTYKWRSAGPGRSLYLLSITGLAALGEQYHSLTGTDFPPPSELLVCYQPHRQAAMPGQKSKCETFLGSTELESADSRIGGERGWRLPQ